MGGYLLYSKYTTKKQFGLDSKSKFLCASDAGWINGHTYSIFGPLSLGKHYYNFKFTYDDFK